VHHPLVARRDADVRDAFVVAIGKEKKIPGLERRPRRVGARVLGVTLNRGSKGFDSSLEYYEEDHAGRTAAAAPSGVAAPPRQSRSTTR